MKINVEQVNNHVQNSWDTLYQFLENTEKLSVKDSVMLIDLMDDIKSREEKFFKVCNSSFEYALICAPNIDIALQLYIAEVSRDLEENSEFEGKIREVSRDHALIMYSRIPGEDGKLVSIKDTIQNMINDTRRVILMDGNLV